MHGGLQECNEPLSIPPGPWQVPSGVELEMRKDEGDLRHLSLRGYERERVDMGIRRGWEGWIGGEWCGNSTAGTCLDASTLARQTL